MTKVEAIDQIEEILGEVMMRAPGVTAADLARAFGVSQTAVGRIKNGRRWTGALIKARSL